MKHTNIFCLFSCLEEENNHLAYFENHCLLLLCKPTDKKMLLKIPETKIEV